MMDDMSLWLLVLSSVSCLFAQNGSFEFPYILYPPTYLTWSTKRLLKITPSFAFFCYSLVLIR